MKSNFLGLWWSNLSHNGAAKLICLVIAVLIWLRLKELTQPGFIDQVVSGTLNHSS